jgi:hypothetical protein
VKLDGRFATKWEAMEAVSADQLKAVGEHEYCVTPAGSPPPAPAAPSSGISAPNRAD